MIKIKEENWGKISGKRTVKRYTVSNGELAVSLISFGATVQRIKYKGLDMVVSLPRPKLYERFAKGCIGATVGRYAGRIAAGRVVIDDAEYLLAQNQNGNHLHGGENGFSTKLWESRIVGSGDDRGVEFTLFSPDGDEGYPGNLNVSVIYRVTEDNTLEIIYNAVSDKDTVINLTNHSYFDPNGFDTRLSLFRRSAKTDNRDVEMTIYADNVLELSDNGIPTGKMLSVDGTRFDFRSRRILARDPDGVIGESPEGYDHTFVLSPLAAGRPAAVAKGLKSGISVEFWTDQPGVQLFTMGNPGKAFALEAQHFPDSPNHQNFPSTLLCKGEKFHSCTVYRFS